MTKALITGGAGFIGSHLAEILLQRGWPVVVLDDLSTGSIKNVAHLKTHPGFSYVLDSVMSRSLMLELIDQADVVFHLAAAVGVRLIVEEPVRTIEANIKATELLLDLCVRKQKPLLLTSTSEVYGKLDKHKFSEDDDVVLGPTSRARWCYAASKIIDELLARAYFKEKDLPTAVVRLFNTIGPRQTGQYGMVAPRFVTQALLGKPLTIYSDGTQRRSFTWVGDVVNAMIKLIQHPEAYGEVFNIGHTDEISIYELAELVKAMTESTSEIVFVPYEQAYEAGCEDMACRLPDLTKIERTIGYRPTPDLPRMLEWLIAYYRMELDQPAVGERPGRMLAVEWMGGMVYHWGNVLSRSWNRLFVCVGRGVHGTEALRRHGDYRRHRSPRLAAGPTGDRPPTRLAAMICHHTVGRQSRGEACVRS
jgi:UDP-glucose 4-epimerase